MQLLGSSYPLDLQAKHKTKSNIQNHAHVKRLMIQVKKWVYMVGDGFDIAGLIVHYEDANGVRSVVNNSKLKFVTSKTVELTQGRVFTTGGIKLLKFSMTVKRLIRLTLMLYQKKQEIFCGMEIIICKS